MNRTVSINLDDEDAFFDPCDRLSSVVAIDLSDDDDDDEFFEASRMSFAGGGASIKRIYSIAPVKNDPSYDMWMAEPGDVKERRKRLLQGMGLVSNKDLLRIASSKIVRTISIKPNAGVVEISPAVSVESPAPESRDPDSKEVEKQPAPSPPKPVPMRPIVLVRSRSDADIDAFSNKMKRRKEEMLGNRSKNKITRTFSGRLAPSTTGEREYSAAAIRVLKEKEKKAAAPEAATDAVVNTVGGGGAAQDAAAVGSFFLIKNLDTGNDFIVKEFNEQGMWNKLNDLQTGKQLTMEEFEKSVGYSPVVKELMRRASRKGKKNSQFSKSFRNSTRKGSALLKNLRGAASGFLVVDKMEKAAKEEKAAREEKSEKEEKESAENIPATTEQQKPEKRWPQWTDAHQHGKSVKEFTALHFSQEIQAHEGSIWTMRFSSDARFLASAGEDTNIHVWEVYECVASQPKPPEDSAPETADSPAEPTADDGDARPNRVALAEMSTLKKGKKTQKGGAVPDHVKLPETMVGLSEKPKCSLMGHKDEVLDLAWHQSQQLLSSSMDKTVRMWDLESQSCLKIFAHSDYVTCIQFNPVVDTQFISGSLDGKLRIWSVADRQVVDWTDVHEMLTAAAYTPDGQGAIVGSQQGNCKIYSARDSTLEHRMDIQKKKTQAKKFPAFQSPSKKLPGFQPPPPPGKITGFQFTPWNPSEVLITSADSRIGIYNGPDLVQKIRGFRNTSSQISASFCPDGKHIISASEDSQVYIWKVEEPKAQAAAKKKTTVVEVNAHENFACKDVSVAITWPGSTKYEAPAVDLHPKKNTAKKPPAAAAPVTPPTQDDETPAAAAALPPLPKKKKEASEEKKEDQPEPAQEEAAEAAAEASTSSATAAAEGETQAPAENASSSSTGTVLATAWGLVIVTASLEGEIKVYQNFGLPVKVARLF